MSQEVFIERDDCRAAGEPEMDEFAADPESVRIPMAVFRSLYPDVAWVFHDIGSRK